MKSILDNINNDKIDKTTLITRRFSGSSITPSPGAQYSKDVDITVPGYIPISLTAFESSGHSLALVGYSIYKSSSNYKCSLYGYGTYNGNAVNISINVVYYKE